MSCRVMCCGCGVCFTLGGVWGSRVFLETQKVGSDFGVGDRVLRAGSNPQLTRVCAYSSKLKKVGADG